MPSGITDFGTAEWLAEIFGINTAPASYYVALCFDDPSVGMDGTMLTDIEPTDSAYARQAIGLGGSNWFMQGNNVVSFIDIAFPTPTADWGQISHYALTDDPAAGNFFAFGRFLNPQLVVAGVGFVIPAGGLVIALTSLENSIAV